MLNKEREICESYRPDVLGNGAVLIAQNVRLKAPVIYKQSPRFFDLITNLGVGAITVAVELFLFSLNMNAHQLRARTSHGGRLFVWA